MYATGNLCGTSRANSGTIGLPAPMLLPTALSSSCGFTSAARLSSFTAISWISSLRRASIVTALRRSASFLNSDSSFYCFLVKFAQAVGNRDTRKPANPAGAGDAAIREVERLGGSVDASLYESLRNGVYPGVVAR